MEKFYKMKGCDETVIERTETEIGKTLPDSYKEFLRQSNGGEYIRKEPNHKYVGFFCCEDIPLYNADFDVQKYLTENIIAFASGDNGYFFDYREPGEPKIICCSFGNLDIAEVQPEADTFEEFINGWL